MNAVFGQRRMRFEADPTSRPTAELSRKVSWIRASEFKDIEGHEVDDNFVSTESNQLIGHGPHEAGAAFLDLEVQHSFGNRNHRPFNSPLPQRHLKWFKAGFDRLLFGRDECIDLALGEVWRFGGTTAAPGRDQ